MDIENEIAVVAAETASLPEPLLEKPKKKPRDPKEILKGILQILALPVTGPFFTIYFAFFWPYTLRMKTICAIKTILEKKSRPSRCAPLMWLVVNYFLWALKHEFGEKGVTIDLVSFKHTIAIIRRMWVAAARRGDIVLDFMLASAPIEFSEFKKRNQKIFKAMLGGVFTDNLREFLTAALEVTKEDQESGVQIYDYIASVVEEDWRTDKANPLKKILYDYYIEKTNRNNLENIVRNFRRVVTMSLSGYADRMMEIARSYHQGDAEILWIKAGQLARQFKAEKPSEETNPQMAEHLTEYCQYANDAGALIYAAMTEAERTAEEKQKAATESEEKKKEEKQAHKAEKKAEREAERARPASELSPYEFLKGRKGRFEFIHCRRSKNNPKAKGITIHDVDHKKYYKNLSADKALRALKDLFVEFKDGKEQIRCIVPLNDAGWKGSFNYGDLQKFFNDQIETYREAHPEAGADELYQHQPECRIIPDGQPLKS